MQTGSHRSPIQEPSVVKVRDGRRPRGPPVSVLTNDLFIWFFILSHFRDSRHEGVKIVFSFGCDVGGVFIRVRRKSTMLTPLLKCPLWHICNASMYADGMTILSAPFWTELQSTHGLFARKNTKISWCWQTHATHLEVIQGHQTWYHSIC